MPLVDMIHDVNYIKKLLFFIINLMYKLILDN